MNTKLMSAIDDAIYERQKVKAQRYAEKQKRKDNLYQIKYGKPKSKRSFSKMTTVFLYVNLTIVELFCMAVMWVTMDLSALPTFITCIIGEILVHFISCEKSKRENIQGGIIHDTAMAELQNKLANLNIPESKTKDIIEDFENNFEDNEIDEIVFDDEAVG